jgi:hypothetical protein
VRERERERVRACVCVCACVCVRACVWGMASSAQCKMRDPLA